jgi:RNA polymerase sigma factor (sigma-70 family)
MRGRSSRDVHTHLRTLFRCGVVGALSDEQLLDRFAARLDETAEEAFTELVHRHGSMVLGVCRRILGDAHDAEDAFQATFLVLARKAGSVVRREKVANWLYGVAVRTAREARVRAARRRIREGRVSKPLRVEPLHDSAPGELRAILDEELARLPARYRGPVVLCELEGVSRPEAARRLGIPEGTLSSRLARAKAQLRDRLAHRGLTLTAVMISTALDREARANMLPVSLVESTVGAATHVAGGATAATAIPATVAALTEGVLKAMLLAKLKGIVLSLGTITAVVSGAVVLAQPGPAPRPAPAHGRSMGGLPPGTATTATEPADRTAELERKLDRILEALGRMEQRAPSPEGVLEDPGTVLDSLVGGDQKLPPPAVAPEGVPPGLDVAPPPQARPQLAPGMTPDVNQAPPSRRLSRNPGSIANRLDAVEQDLGKLQRLVHGSVVQVKALERRLAELEKHVGGRGSETPAEPPSSAPPPPPPNLQ